MVVSTISSYLYWTGWIKPPAELTENVAKFNPNSSDAETNFKKIICSLAQQPSERLEKTLRTQDNKIETLSLSLIKKITESPNDETKPEDALLLMKMLEVCCRIIGLETLKNKFNTDPTALAKDEALFTGKPPRVINVLSNSSLPHLKYYSPLIIRYLYQIALLPFTILKGILSISSNVFNNPVSSVTDLTNALESYKVTYTMLRLWSEVIFFYAFYYLESTPLAMGASAGSVIAYGAFYYFLKYILKLDNTENVRFLQNLNNKVRTGEISKGHERVQQKNDVISCWTKVSDSYKFTIPFLLGPPGVGKTQFVENLAWSCVNDRTFDCYGKTVLSINTAKLLEKNHFIDKLFQEISGKEDEMILFFDEFHNAANPQHSILEQLKTDLLEKNIRCIIATTNDEYETSIRPNGAFVSRTKPIDILPLGLDETINLIQQSVMENPRPSMEVTQNAYVAILEISQNHPAYKTRYNPRKSIQIFSAVMAAASQWRPMQLNAALETAKLQENQLKLNCNEKNRDKNWSGSSEGKKAIHELQETTKAVQELKVKINSQLQQYSQIKLLQDWASKYESERKTLIHQLAEQAAPSPEGQKRFLYIKFVLLPSVHQLLQAKIAAFEKEFQEKIPLQIDATFVKAQFPLEKVKDG